MSTYDSESSSDDAIITKVGRAALGLDVSLYCEFENNVDYTRTLQLGGSSVL
jgi:hypothetical protein